MAEYSEYKSQNFESRMKAEEWAAKEKARLKSGELGVAKINIEYDDKRQAWKATVLLPI